MVTEKSALPSQENYILKYLKMENYYFKLLQYFTILVFLLYVWTNNAALMSIRDFFHKNLTNPEL